MNNMTASGLIYPHQFYTCCSPTLQLVLFYDDPPLDNGASTSTSSWAVVRKKDITDVLPLDGQEVIPLAWYFFTFFFIFTENACLGISFLLDITVPTAFVLKSHKWSKISGLENHLPCTHSGPYLLFYHTTCQQHWTPCCVLSWWNVPQHILAGCRSSFFLPHKVQTFLFYIYGAFHWYKHERIYVLEMGILPRR